MLLMTEVVLPKLASLSAELGLVRAQLMEREDLTMGDFEATAAEAEAAERNFFGKD